jgi:Na+-translocating ferredoxin:NAD+ oxidoreductase RnfC subunit
MSTLADFARQAGIIGAGGAGFPTHVKLASAVNTVIVNAAECEPLMRGDLHLMQTRAGDIVATLKKIVSEISGRTGAEVLGVIGVKIKYDQAVKSFRDHSAKLGVRVLELDNVYPAGDEHYLVFEATGRAVPEGGIPLDVGVVVINVGTMANIADAVNGKPVTERIVTLGGAVTNPKVAFIPVGTAFSEIIPRLGVKIDDYVILVNGPMMGRVTEDLSEVVTKTTGGIFILPKNHSHVMRMTRPLSTEIRIGKSACEVCRYCTDFCPRYLLGHRLEPHKIMRVINYDRDLDSDTITSAWLCCECGLCDLWSCPMSLSPRVIYREFKRRLKDAGIKNPHRRAGLTQDFYRPFRGVPADKLMRRLGLGEYDIKPPFDPAPWPVSFVRIPLDQHIGSAAIPVVKQGEKVVKGQLIGEIPEGKLGARYHASIDGTVTAINKSHVEISGKGK